VFFGCRLMQTNVTSAITTQTTTTATTTVMPTISLRQIELSSFPLSPCDGSWPQAAVEDRPSTAGPDDAVAVKSSLMLSLLMVVVTSGCFCTKHE